MPYFGAVCDYSATTGLKKVGTGSNGLKSESEHFQGFVRLAKDLLNAPE